MAQCFVLEQNYPMPFARASIIDGCPDSVDECAVSPDFRSGPSRDAGIRGVAVFVPDSAVMTGYVIGGSAAETSLCRDLASERAGQDHLLPGSLLKRLPIRRRRYLQRSISYPSSPRLLISA